jgi:hypothetical protein
MDDELHIFKTQIDLRQYAATQGYELDTVKSCPGSYVMRRGGDKIVIKLNEATGHYVYFTIGNDSDSGSIIDFIQNGRRGCLIGGVRLVLRSWMGMPASTPRPVFRPLEPRARGHAGPHRGARISAIGRGHVR